MLVLISSRHSCHLSLQQIRMAEIPQLKTKKYQQNEEKVEPENNAAGSEAKRIQIEEDAIIAKNLNIQEGVLEYDTTYAFCCARCRCGFGCESDAVGSLR